MALWKRRRDPDEEVTTPRTTTASTAAGSTVLELLAVPKQVSVRKVGRKGTLTFMATGIVNPFGPTLNVLAIDGNPEPGREAPLLRFMLNPFTHGLAASPPSRAFTSGLLSGAA
jgi:hypothetical protein